MMLRLSREIIHWNHFQIRYLTLEEGWKNKAFVTTCHKCDYRLPPALDNKWFSREVVYNMVAFISMFSSLLALYLSFLIQAFVIYCSKANNLFSAWNSRDVTSSSKRQFCLFFFSHECIGRNVVSISYISIFPLYIDCNIFANNWVINITPDSRYVLSLIIAE